MSVTPSNRRWFEGTVVVSAAALYTIIQLMARSNLRAGDLAIDGAVAACTIVAFAAYLSSVGLGQNRQATNRVLIILHAVAALITGEVSVWVSAPLASGVTLSTIGVARLVALVVANLGISVFGFVYTRFAAILVSGAMS